MKPVIIPNVKIAVVDHDKPTRGFITNVMMYSVNRDVQAFDSAKAFMEVLAQGHVFDLVFADTRLPGMSGFDLLQHVKKELPDTRFVALSSIPADEVLTGSLGADTFLAKPFELKDLFAIVQRFVVGDT